MSSVTLLDGNRAPWFVKTTTPFIALSTIAIVLRFWSRAIGPKKPRFWWDDWTALLAWAEGVAVSALGVAWVYHGLGRHVEELSPTEVKLGQKLLWISYFNFTPGITFSKISVLLFYARVFTTNRLWFKRALIVTWVLCIIWFIGFFFEILFECIPIHKVWDSEVPGHCTDVYVMFLVCGVYDATLDVIILLLPLPMIWGLHCGRARKMSILFAFICGYLALIPSVGRSVVTIQEGKSLADDITYRNIPELLWCYVELPIAVISICVPSWFHLFKRANKHGVLSIFSTRDPESRGPTRAATLIGGPQHSKAQEQRDYGISNVNGSGSQVDGEEWNRSTPIDLNWKMIQVRKEVSIERDDAV